MEVGGCDGNGRVELLSWLTGERQRFGSLQVNNFLRGIGCHRHMRTDSVLTF